MHLILRLTALCGIGTLAACGTIGPGYSPMAQGPQSPAAQSEPTQTAALEPEPTQVAPRRPRRTASPAARAEAGTTASVTSQDTKPVVFNSPEWKEREKRREDELNRKINSICRGC
jgi:hypothetical protein